MKTLVISGSGQISGEFSITFHFPYFQLLEAVGDSVLRRSLHSPKEVGSRDLHFTAAQIPFCDLPKRRTHAARRISNVLLVSCPIMSLRFYLHNFKISISEESHISSPFRPRSRLFPATEMFRQLGTVKISLRNGWIAKFHPIFLKSSRHSPESIQNSPHIPEERPAKISWTDQNGLRGLSARLEPCVLYSLVSSIG
jgi:hypothetical protein